MSRVARAVVRIQPVLFLAIALILAGTASHGQIRDVTPPPAMLRAAGQFNARPLSRRPVIDGRPWIAADVKPASSPGTVPVPTRAFSLTLTDCGDHDGDFVRCQLLFQRERAAPCVLTLDSPRGSS